MFFSKRRFGIRWFGIRWPEISVLIRDLWWDGHHSKWVPHQNTKTVLIPHGLWHLEINICLVVSALYFGCRTIGIWTASKSDLGRFLTATSFTYFLLIAGLLVIGSISAGLDLYAFSVLGLALVRPLVTRLTDRPMVNNPAGTDTGSAYLTTTTGMQAVATRLVCLNCLNNVIGISLLQSSEISTRVIQASFLASVVTDSGLIYSHIWKSIYAWIRYKWTKQRCFILMCPTLSDLVRIKHDQCPRTFPHHSIKKT